MKKLLSLILILCISLPFFTSCSAGEYTFRDYTVFDTETVISGYAPSEAQFNERAGAIIGCLTEYHRLYDIYYEYEGINNLKTVNDNAGIAPVKVDMRIIDLIDFGREIYEKTGGMTNIFMGSVLGIWHEYREEGKSVPEKSILLDASHHTSPDLFVCDREKGTVYITDSMASLDVGALAKGYAVEKTAEFISKNGWTGIALSVGGNVRCIGTKESGKSWKTGIRNPYDEGEPIMMTLSLSDLSAVTSGSYQRFYEVDGKFYHHIIHPDTLFPDDTYVSVTVICRDSGYADALSTALFNMTEEDGRALLESVGFTADAVWLYSNGKRSETDGIKKLTVGNAD